MEFKGTITSNCLSKSPRTGFGDCDIVEDYTVALLFMRPNVLIETNIEAFVQALPEYAHNIGRPVGDAIAVWPIKNIASDPITGGDVVTSDIGARGGTVSVGENQTMISYEINAGSCFMKELYKFEKQKWRVLRIDAQGYIWGTIVTRNNKDFPAGFAVSDIFPREVPANDNNSYQIFLDVRYSINYRNEKKNKFGAYIGDAVPDGLIGVTLKETNTQDEFKVVTSCEGIDITNSTWAESILYVGDGGSEASDVSYVPARNAIMIGDAGRWKIAPAYVLYDEGIEGYDGVDKYITVN